MAESTPAEGKIFGHYRILGPLGAGGMGVVYSAYDTILERKVAIKVVGPRVLADKPARDLLLHEARAASSLNHPNVCTVHEVGGSDGEAYIVMEQVEGQPLSSLVATHGLSPDLVVRYGKQIADALAHAHEHGVIHRDLKSTNVVVTPEGRVKVLDFGLAARLRDTELQQAVSSRLPLSESRTIVGTLPYLAPELLRGEPAEPRTDTWALGVLLYEMASGSHPFGGRTAFELSSAILREPPRPLPTSIPSSLRAVILRCLEKSPGERYQSTAEVRGGLERLETELKSGHRAGTRSARLAVSEGISDRIAKLWRIAVPVLLVAVLVTGGLYYRWRLSQRLTDKDTIVLTDFSNSTGDPIFDDTLKMALNVSLQQSPFLNLLSGAQVTKTMKEMTRPAGTKLTPELAREVCQRTGSKAYIAGAIGSLGSEYVVGLKAVNCQSGATLAQEQSTAASKEKVVEALGQVASKLRAELGESLATVQRFDVPLVQATTPSLEALKAYGLGVKADNEKGAAAALPYLQRAIELDPNFAMGYDGAGNAYSNLGELERASEYLTKAFQVRDHASERERLTITADYYQNVTGELDKAAQAFQEEIDNHPRGNTAYANLGTVLDEEGQYEKAMEVATQAVRLAPHRASLYANLASYAMALQRFDQAGQIVHDAQSRNLDVFELHLCLYALAFLRADSEAMAEQQKWFAAKPDYESFGLMLASDTEAYGGHLNKARQLSKLSVDSAIRADSKETGAIWQAIAAQREAAYGHVAEARQKATDALKLAPASQGVKSEVALAFAFAGDTARAESLAQDLAKRYPLDTQMQSLWLPAIQAKLALNRKDFSAALQAPQAAPPLDLGLIPFASTTSCLYPVYVRGEAYLSAGQGSAAAAEFQKILDHSGIVWNCWTGSLAHLGLARANALQSKNSQGADADAARVRSLAAYKDFFMLWKEADPDVPILKQATEEYAKLQ